MRQEHPFSSIQVTCILAHSYAHWRVGILGEWLGVVKALTVYWPGQHFSLFSIPRVKVWGMVAKCESYSNLQFLCELRYSDNSHYRTVLSFTPGRRWAFCSDETQQETFMEELRSNSRTVCRLNPTSQFSPFCVDTFPDLPSSWSFLCHISSTHNF